MSPGAPPDRHQTITIEFFRTCRKCDSVERFSSFSKWCRQPKRYRRVGNQSHRVFVVKFVQRNLKVLQYIYGPATANIFAAAVLRVNLRSFRAPRWIRCTEPSFCRKITYSRRLSKEFLNWFLSAALQYPSNVIVPLSGVYWNQSDGAVCTACDRIECNSLRWRT